MTTPYRHFKNRKLYTLVGESFNAKDQAVDVIYKPAYVAQYPQFNRPKTEFFGTVEVEGSNGMESVRRYEPVEIIVYGHDTCSFCVEAKKLLTARGLDFTSINVKQDERARELVGEMCDARGVKRTVPQIMIGAEHIGGYSDLRAYLG